MASKRKFRYWTTEEIQAAIRQIEEASVSGVRFINYVGGGTVSQCLRDEYEAILRDLYDVLDDRLGLKPMTVRKVIMVGGAKGFSGSRGAC